MKNVYIDKLDDIFNKHKNTCRRTIKMKLANVKSGTFIDSDKERNEKEPKFEIGDMQEYKNIKTFLKKFTFQIDQNKFF